MGGGLAAAGERGGLPPLVSDQEGSLAVANIGEIIKEVEVVPIEAPVEPQVNPSRTPDHEEAPSRELQPAGS